jgi:hypothetical protein
MSEEIKQEGDFKVTKKKGRPKKLVSKDNVTKVELNKKEEDAVPESETKRVVLSPVEESKEEQEKTDVGLQGVGQTHTESEEAAEDNKKEVVNITEITDEEQKEEVKYNEAPLKQEEKENLPENIEKLVSFMQETGGTIEDYVRINADYSNVDDKTLVREYYKQTKPHLDSEEINFVLEDNFAFDEEVDEERDVRKKKLAYKEEIAKAKNFLEETKKKYYDEIKLRPGVTQEQQKAMDFFNRHNEEQKVVREKHNRFKSSTNDFFTNKFKGFDFDIGDKKFRYNVTNTDNVSKSQSDLTNFIGKFLNNEGEVKDFAGYHKAIYAAENVDNIANHFYEQGKADAVKDVMAKSKNISNEPRATAAQGDIYINGLKVKAISGVDSSKLKIKTTKK